MDREAVEGLRLGTVLIIISATLAIGSIIFWYARLYTGHYYDKTVEQNQQAQTLELEALSMQGITDMPVASAYTIVSREWRGISDVSIFDKAGTLITTAKTTGKVWALTPVLTKADGVTVVSQLVAPEQVLYTVAGKIYSSKLSGRVFVTVTQDKATKAYSIQVKLQQ